MELQRQSLKPATWLSLGRYHISEEYGFLLRSPLDHLPRGWHRPQWVDLSTSTTNKKELPDEYRPWMEIANKLPHLIESHQLQAHVYKMPFLDCRFLKSHREQRLAHLVLAAITMGFIWQEGETQPQKVLPRTLAIPFVEVSRMLGLPPILVHSDLVLTNWTKRNPEGPWEISNLETIISFPGGESLRAFILVTVLVEKAAAPGIKALVQGVEAILQQSQDTLLQALQQLRLSIQDITRTLAQMHDYVDPDIFYTVIRIFLSGWKDNPAMPVGLVYEGVATEPLRYSGGSAAQSSVLQAFDEFLGIQHCMESVGFLQRMRDYMPPSHKAFLEDLHSSPSLRDYVLTSGAGCCLMAYNQCVDALVELRSYHINMVARYIISVAAKVRSGMLSHLSPHALEDRGTGGTAVMSFLKSIREKTVEAILHPCT